MRTVDNLFIVNSALVVDRLSVFSTQDRITQTAETLYSIAAFDAKMQTTSDVLVLDMSPTVSRDDLASMIEPILETRPNFKNMTFANIQTADSVNAALAFNNRSMSELYGFTQFFRQQNEVDGDYSIPNIQKRVGRVVKLSGRYRLSNHFLKIPFSTDKPMFQFAHPVPTWQNPKVLEHHLVDPPLWLYKLRLWCMNASLMDLYFEILNHSIEFSRFMDIEHCMFYMLNHIKARGDDWHRFDIHTYDKIGVQGYIAPSGEYIDE